MSDGHKDSNAVIRLPVELIFKIADDLYTSHGDAIQIQNTLAQLSTTCRAMHHHSRKLVFCRVVLRSLPGEMPRQHRPTKVASMQAFNKLIDEDPSLLSLIRDLRLNPLPPYSSLPASSLEGWLELMARLKRSSNYSLLTRLAFDDGSSTEFSFATIVCPPQWSNLEFLIFKTEWTLLANVFENLPRSVKELVYIGSTKQRDEPPQWILTGGRQLLPTDTLAIFEQVEESGLKNLKHLQLVPVEAELCVRMFKMFASPSLPSLQCLHLTVQYMFPDNGVCKQLDFKSLPNLRCLELAALLHWNLRCSWLERAMDGLSRIVARYSAAAIAERQLKFSLLIQGAPRIKFMAVGRGRQYLAAPLVGSWRNSLFLGIWWCGTGTWRGGEGYRGLSLWSNTATLNKLVTIERTLEPTKTIIHCGEAAPAQDGMEEFRFRNARSAREESADRTLQSSGVKLGYSRAR
ncbi:hypothetical protein BKA70DRAFT_1397517 [Coprinopsis sp. MPI-PUGE-AT-0042]|nr:hypothetical protein BKA70DRAFT_1397517 [Coprinopsis sp. MPI-PUGE-AT-0042]